MQELTRWQYLKGVGKIVVLGFIVPIGLFWIFSGFGGSQGFLSNTTDGEFSTLGNILLFVFMGLWYVGLYYFYQNKKHKKEIIKLQVKQNTNKEEYRPPVQTQELNDKNSKVKRNLEIVFSSERTMPAHLYSYGNRTQSFGIPFFSDFLSVDDEYNMASHAWYCRSAHKGLMDLPKEALSLVTKIGEDCMIGAYLASWSGDTDLVEETSRLIREANLSKALSEHLQEKDVLDLVRQSQPASDYFTDCIQYGERIGTASYLQAKEKPKKGNRILHFEDDKFMADMYREKFRINGYRCINYQSPSHDPVSIVVSEKPDLIIMDTIMPIMDGFRATQILKQDKRTRFIPILGLSNLGEQQDFKLAHDSGMNDYWVAARHTPSEVVKQVGKMLKQLNS